MDPGFTRLGPWHLIQNLQELNSKKTTKNENIDLFTLDVESLYPSIDPTLALEAIKYSLQLDKTTDKNTLNAMICFIKSSFKSAYVEFEC